MQGGRRVNPPCTPEALYVKSRLDRSAAPSSLWSVASRRCDPGLAAANHSPPPKFDASRCYPPRTTSHGRFHRQRARESTVDIEPDMPLLWVLRDELGLTGTKFGCGIAAMRRLHGASRRRGDALLLSRRSATVDGKTMHDDRGPVAERQLHPVQQAWIEDDVPQCGYCQSGQIMAAAALLRRHPQPTDADIDAG